MEMQLRSGRRLRSAQEAPVPPVRRRRRSPSSERDGGGDESRLSDLPDALLLLVLAHLGSTAEAARTTCTLSRRFAALWPELPVLVFRDLDPDTVGRLLARARHTNLTRLEVEIHRRDRDLAASQISSLLRAAEEHKPKELVFSIGGGTHGNDDVTFELPYFTQATHMKLKVWDRGFTLPPAAGEFGKLQELALLFCCVDPGELVRRCPCLRVLDMYCQWTDSQVDLHSGSLQEIVLRYLPPLGLVGDATPRRVDIVAPKLKKFSLESYMEPEMAASFSEPAPMMEVETLSFRYFSMSSRSVGLARLWRLMTLATEMVWRRRRNGKLISNLVRVRVLSLVIHSTGCFLSDADRSFAEEILRLPVNNFSILKLDLISNKWLDFGTVVFGLLKTVSAIQRLELVLPQSKEQGWTPKRFLDYDPDDWRNEHILLPNLEELEVQRFNATDYDLDILSLIFAYAPQLKTVRIQLSAWVSPNDQGCKELRRFFWAKASAECYINGILSATCCRSDQLLRVMRHHPA